jgi:hypothetical protein
MPDLFLELDKRLATIQRTVMVANLPPQTLAAMKLDCTSFTAIATRVAVVI